MSVSMSFFVVLELIYLIILHCFKYIQKFLAGHAEVAYGVANDKLGDGLYMGLEDDGTPQARLYPYFMASCSSQVL